MNKKYALALAAAFLILSVLLCFAVISKREKEDEEEVKDAFRLENSLSSPLYTVKANGEKIGIFDSAGGGLQMSIDTFLFTLPEADRTLIENGFEIEKSEIYCVVEDYTG